MQNFPESIGWHNWGGIMENAALFAPLVETALLENGIPPVPISPGFPGTHAVFQAGEVIVKLFAPLPLPDAGVELPAYRAMAGAGIPGVPALLGQGAVRGGGHTFPYLLISRCSGAPLRETWQNLDGDARQSIARRTGGWARRYHALPSPLPPGHPCGAEEARAALMGHVRANAQKLSLAGWPEAAVCRLAHPGQMLAAGGRWAFVHGDLTEDHIFADTARKETPLSIIDFADSRVAPAEYEWPPLFYGAFERDASAFSAFLSEMGTPFSKGFANRLAGAVMVHGYGAPILQSAHLPGYIPEGDAPLGEILALGEMDM